MSPHGGPGVGRLRFYLVVAGAGAVVMALEIIASRVLAPHFGSSVYVWGSIISVFLAALSLGYGLGGRLADRWPSLPALGGLLLLAALCQAALLLGGERIAAALGAATHGSPAGTLLATTLLFGPPSVLLATVSPYAVKLAARDLSHLGNTAGRLFAISTAGSLAGTLGCTFGLIPFLQLRPLLALLLAATAATGAVALGLPRGRLVAAGHGGAVALLALAGLVGGRPAPLPEGALYTRITPYQSLAVGDLDERRFLRSNGFLQSAIEVATGEPATHYVRAVPLALALQPQARRMLVLGMGGATVGAYLQRRVPDLEVDYVELDPAIPEVATRFFGFAPGPRTRVHVGDARRFLAASEASWDIIFCDAYVGLSVPFHLATREFMAEVEAHLAPGGVFVFNLAGGQEDPFSRAVLHTVRSELGTARAYAVRGSGNVLVLAGPAVTAYPPDLERRAGELDRRWSFRPSLASLLALEMPQEPPRGDELVLSDAFAPVEHLVDVDALRDADEAQWRSLLTGGDAASAAAPPAETP